MAWFVGKFLVKIGYVCIEMNMVNSRRPTYGSIIPTPPHIQGRANLGKYLFYYRKVSYYLYLSELIRWGYSPQTTHPIRSKIEWGVYYQ